MKVAIIGAGLAGSECAWVLTEVYGIDVTLFEMKALQKTPAQLRGDHYAELVCSNSLKSKSQLNPAGVLKEEMKTLGSLIIPSAYSASVPAGETLAVDRDLFSGEITKKLKSHPRIHTVDKIIHTLEDVKNTGDFSRIVVATGPLTEDNFAETLQSLTGNRQMYFYDAIAPIIDGDSIDKTIAFYANRETRTRAYERKLAHKEQEKHEETLLKESTETGDYLNLPLNREEYNDFVTRILAGDKVQPRDFEEMKYFNGCQPIEALAEKGVRTLSFGPMKPRGLIDPRTGKMPYAAVQLRREHLGDDAWNMVGFQTRLTWTAQKEILRTLPGLANAEFFRMGSMHRNTYFVSPMILNTDFSLRAEPSIHLAGQITGVEGYLESAATGVLIGHIIGTKLRDNRELTSPPPNTSLGSLARHCLFGEAEKFTPMNIHWGLFTQPTEEDIERYAHLTVEGSQKKKLDKSSKRVILAARATELFKAWIKEQGLKL